MHISAVIVAGGKGLRMKQKARKQYLSLDGMPVLVHTLKVFAQMDQIDDICLVIPETDRNYCRTQLLEPYKLGKRVQLAAGGRERQDSVYNGINTIARHDGIVVIHDGVRPFVLPGHIEKCILEAGQSGACILGIPAFDTLKKIDSAGCVHETMKRDGIWLAQTPQVFKYALIKSAYESAMSEGFYGTDDASLVERLGHSVKIVSGSPYNIKITTEEDFLLAKAVCRIVNNEKRC